MHGREVDDRKRWLHMRSVRSLGTTVASSNSSSTAIVGAGFFTKDGRRISIGDCALFKPIQENCPPFIGIIRWLSSDKEDYLKLGVNWLYRPAEVKLGKGISLEAAPNEVFYSFHEDEIPAASLLHPCKVAFLHKGIELPTGISSFVCRRVYNTTDNCLWWLSDRDYVNERQEEVDLLLNKTQLEMHAAVQSGGRSPKTSNGPTSTTQLKPGSDSVQNTSTSLPSQFKGKKRERGDRDSDPIKKERYSKNDDGESGHYGLESMLKSEIAKITDKGGLVDNEGVEKLVQLMQPDRAEGKVDLASRKMLADVISATDRFECLGQFVQLRGLSVLDEWLQEVHNGKVGDSSSPKEIDKSVEDFLFALLRALDKLPVNLNALRACPLGKSVNHLRSHKNLEIQKKARSLVDTWKKRVEVEMQIGDEKSGMTQAVSWPSKAGIIEVSHGGNRRMGASSEVHIKGSITQPSTHKTTSVKLAQGEGTAKSTSTSPGSVKLPTSPVNIAVSSKDSHCKTGVSTANSEMPLTIVKGEKSSSSSQSQNNSQSCSSDHVKTVASAWKEDARSSTAGSPNMSKISTGASRHKRSSNGSSGTALSGAQKETALGKLRPVNKNAKSEKVSQSGSTCERALDMPGSDQGSSHRLIVRLPNPGRSPARSATSFDDPSVMVSRASSPGHSEKHDQYDRKVKGKSDYSRPNIAVDVNTESWQSNDVKDGFIGSEEGDGSPATIADEQRCRSGEEIGKPREASRATCSSSANNKERFTSENKSSKLCDATLSSITALIESCVKYSQANAPVPAGDDGMNLLASVAAGEMSKSDLGSPVGSPGVHSPVPEDSCTHNDSASRLSREDVLSQRGRSDDGAEMDAERGDHCSSLHVQDGLQNATNVADDSKTTSSVFDKKLATCTSGMDLKQTVDPCSNSDVKADEATSSVPLVLSSAALIEDGADSEGANQLLEKRKRGFTSSNGNDSQDFQLKAKSPIVDETKKLDGTEEKIAGNNATVASDFVHDSMVDGCKIKNVASPIDDKKKTVEESSSCPSLEMDGENKKHVHESLSFGILRTLSNCTDAVEESGDTAVNPSGSNVLKPHNVNDFNSQNAVTLEARTHAENWESKKVEQACDAHQTLNGQVGAAVGSVVSDLNSDSAKDESERKEVIGSSGPASNESPTNPTKESEQRMKSGPKSTRIETEVREECASNAEVSSSSVAAGSDTATKLDFDLNEGFPVDDGNQGEQGISVGPECLSAVHLPSPLPFSVPSMSSSLPASITVAAATKGSFVPPENLLKSKGELGWKGSAATSAFRPAEPRKVLEMALSTVDMPLADTSVGKQGRAPLDIDLNVADDRVLEDMASKSSHQETTSKSGLNSRCEGGRTWFGSDSATRGAAGLDLDLNKIDEDTDVAQLSVSSIRRLDVPVFPVRSSLSGGFLNGEVNVLRDFDLNNGPGLDEVASESAQCSQQLRSSLPSLPPVAGLRMSSTDVGIGSSWFPAGNSYPTITTPAILPDRSDLPYPIVVNAGMQRIIGPPAGSTPLGPDIYRGPVLSSSPAVAFSSATPFPYPGFPFSSSFSIPSTSFSGVSTTIMESSSGGGLYFPSTPSPLVGPVGAVSSHYPRPYVISIPDGPSASESSRKWGMQGLDLNSGPGGTDMDGKDERFTSVSRQFPVPTSHALVEEQVRMLQATGGVLKRKEPEGGWDTQRYSYKQPSWQ